MPFQFPLLLDCSSLLLRSFWALMCLPSPDDLSPSGQGATPSTSSSQGIFKFDVFISFRGTDTRNTFVDHLYHHLIRKGIFVFKDDKKLQKGKLTLPQLTQAIQNSRLSIIVFSKDYASSTWCLDEMATIANCHKRFKQTVFPVFYDVEPSHVRNQKGAYEKAFVLHTEKFKHDPDKVGRWKIAMRQFGMLVGWDVRDKPEFGEIENLVQEVTKSLGHKISWYADDLIGIQPRIEELENLLKLSSEQDDIRVLGIWGMGGIGKTTHAAVLYDRISYQFTACCFIENVSKIYRDGGAIAVQKQILHQTLGETNLEAYSPTKISGIIKNRLHNIKVLVVLDSVDQLEQLEELAINPKLLHTGSRMIITTRDEHILKVYEADKILKVPLLNNNDAHKLFCKRAFKTEEQSSKCGELIPEVLKYAQCLPLAIKVLGSSLCTRDATQWRDVLDRLGNNPDKKIMDVLEISVDGLQYEDKEIFLHIACFFKGEREEYVKRILDACGLNPYIGIQSLIEKSLITIKNEEIHMHEMLQKLGEKIVRHNCPDEPRSWSRVWHYEDFHRLLMTETVVTNKVKAIVLNKKEDVFKCKAQGLSKLMNLRLFILYQKNFSGELEFLSDKLRYLLWDGYPFPILPLQFEPNYLVELNMPNSKIQQLWEGHKHLPYLKRVDLSNSKFLIETPHFEGIPNLERLDLMGCTSLVWVHPSIGLLTKLTFLSLRNCSNLVSIDFAIASSSVSNLSSLRVLRLSGCIKLEKTPDFIGALSLEYLDMDGCTSLSGVHESIGALAKLRFLSMRDCTNLVSIPSNINTMTSLITLDFYGCSKLRNLPVESAVGSSSRLKSLISIDLSFCDLCEVPDAIGELSCLERLNLQGNKFSSLPFTITKLSRLAYLNLSHCHGLQSFPDLPTISASLVGRYFKTTSGSRDHRSGLYVFDCPQMMAFNPSIFVPQWLRRLVENPNHFRCGFDIVVPHGWTDADSQGRGFIPLYFIHKFKGNPVIRIEYSNMDDNWVGFAFSVAFEVNNNLHAISTSPHHSSSLQFPHPFYLSFESEYTEERFDMPLNLQLNKIDSSKHLWTIYISREHCHFVQTGAHITFKACPGLMVKEWGLFMVKKIGVEVEFLVLDHLFIDNVEKSSNFGLKIQLPYNWLVTKEDEVENVEAKGKEIALSNLGLSIG